MDIVELTDRILAGASTKTAIELDESVSLLKWTNLGRKIDQILRTGGFMALAAVPMAQVFINMKQMEAAQIGAQMYKEKWGQKKPYAGFPDPESPEDMELHAAVAQSIGAKREKARKGLKTALGLLSMGLVGQLVGMTSMFQRLGAMIDKKNYRRAVLEASASLLEDLKPEHRKSTAPLLDDLFSSDPFAEPSVFATKLRVLSRHLASLREPSYQVHIESIQRFLDIL